MGESMTRRLSALAAIAVLWFSAVFSGTAYAGTWGFGASGYYGWFGWGTFLACTESHYFEPGVFGVNWSEYTTNSFWANGWSCGDGTPFTSLQDNYNEIYAGSGYGTFCGNAYSGAQGTSVIVVMGSPDYNGVCRSAGGPKKIVSDVDVYFDSSLHYSNNSYTR
jgi:hypothetical protein